jgi:hypothetical protein
MEENNINRRDMIRISSLAALSNMLTPALVSASVSSPKLNDFRLEKMDPDNGICYMNAATRLIITFKKISARGHAGTPQTDKESECEGQCDHYTCA